MSDISKLELVIQNQHDVENYKNPDEQVGKVEQKYTQDVQKFFRKSNEYKQWSDRIRSKYILTCPFSHISNEIPENSNLLQLHHHPFQMSELSDLQTQQQIDKFKIMYNKQYKTNVFENYENHELLKFIPISLPFSILQDVHLKNLIQFVPMSETYHKLYHNIKDEQNEYQMPDIIDIKDEFIYNLEKRSILMKVFDQFQKGEYEPFVTPLSDIE